MSFDVHPPPGSAPLSLSAGRDGGLIRIAEHAAIDPVTGRNSMFIGVVQVSESDGNGPPRAIGLATDSGPSAKVGNAPTPIHAQPGAQSPVAIASMVENDGIHLIEVEVLESQAGWRILLTNTDTRTQRYVWVVGDTRAATRQPWLDIPVPVVALDTVAGENPSPQDLSIANYGPGLLTLTDTDDTDLGSGFRLLAIAPRLLGGNRRAVARIGFTAPDTPGARSAAHTFSSSDRAAGEVTGHNNRVALTATVRPRPSRALLTVKSRPAGAQPDVGTQFTLDRPLTRVGRQADSDIVRNDRSVDPRHAEFRLDSGEFTVVDMGSAYGTYVNRDPVDEAVLMDADDVQIGKFRLGFSAGS